jgi:DNA-binding LytR/AlgR family response regulator
MKDVLQKYLWQEITVVLRKTVDSNEVFYLTGEVVGVFESSFELKVDSKTHIIPYSTIIRIENEDDKCS